MSHFLILGGTRSGKSAHALRIGERILKREMSASRRDCPGLFIATAQAHDAEMEERIRLHRMERGPLWHTVEEPLSVPEILDSKAAGFGAVIVDCLTLWVSNLMYHYPQETKRHFSEMVSVLSRLDVPVIMVSNEVGLGIVPASEDARRFRDLAGRLHQDVATVCSNVIFMVSGIPMPVKGGENLV